MQDLINIPILKMPNWLRWLLVLPVAFLADLASQSVVQIICHAFPFQAVLPYFYDFFWHVIASIVFVAGGLKLAPKYWFVTATILLLIKCAIAVANICELVRFLIATGAWTAPMPVTQAPVWWSLICNAVFLAFAALIIKADKGIRKVPTEQEPVYNF